MRRAKGTPDDDNKTFVKMALASFSNPVREGRRTEEQTGIRQVPVGGRRRSGYAAGHGNKRFVTCFCGFHGSARTFILRTSALVT
jgi:hypothetical protein